MSSKPKAVYAGRLERYPDAVWLIWSNKWNCWYRANSCGYTADVTQAGLYTREEAAKHYDGPATPRRNRDTEPFPMSAVRAEVRRALLGRRLQLERLRLELAQAEEKFEAFFAKGGGAGSTNNGETGQ